MYGPDSIGALFIMLGLVSRLGIFRFALILCGLCVLRG
jgi:hypothetical protein